MNPLSVELNRTDKFTIPLQLIAFVGIRLAVAFRASVTRNLSLIEKPKLAATSPDKLFPEVTFIF
jgi:hypothetical protein